MLNTAARMQPSLIQKRRGSTGGSLSSYFVTPRELHDAMASSTSSESSTSKRIVPLCASWFLPNDPQKRTGRQVFEQNRIPTARFFDLDAVKDNDSPYPHMLPTAETFAEAMSNLGIKRDDRVVVYDTQELGIFSAPRVAWTLRVFGHPSIHILNNFRIWVEQGLPIEGGNTSTVPEIKTQYSVPSIHPDAVVCFREIKSIAKENGKKDSEDIQVIDARSSGRFTGKEPEPRPGLPSGHIPGSINLPLPEILDAKTKALLPKAELRKIFEAKGLNPERPIISTCGTGVMAAVLDAALSEADFGDSKNRRVYDGSWTYAFRNFLASSVMADLFYREYAQRVSPSDNLIVSES